MISFFFKTGSSRILKINKPHLWPTKQATVCPSNMFYAGISDGAFLTWCVPNYADLLELVKFVMSIEPGVFMQVPQWCWQPNTHWRYGITVYAALRQGANHSTVVGGSMFYIFGKSWQIFYSSLVSKTLVSSCLLECQPWGKWYNVVTPSWQFSIFDCANKSISHIFVTQRFISICEAGKGSWKNRYRSSKWWNFPPRVNLLPCYTSENKENSLAYSL